MKPVPHVLVQRFNPEAKRYRPMWVPRHEVEAAISAYNAKLAEMKENSTNE
jgi:hypothetical protein